MPNSEVEPIEFEPVEFEPIEEIASAPKTARIDEGVADMPSPQDEGMQDKPRKPSAQASAKPRKSVNKPSTAKNIPQGMKSALKRSPRKAKSGKPSTLDDAPSKGGVLGGLSLQLIMQLAAPHTWAASIVPVLLAMALAVADEGELSALMCIVLLCISILMQSAVNAFNDYRDFVAGTDTKENQKDPSDAVLVYNDVNPTAVRTLAIIFVGLAFLLGIYVIVVSGFVPFVIALIGAACIFLYSAGPKPISHAPLGEVVSGFVMGGLITMASYIALVGYLSFTPLLLALPVMIGIALIMFTNNTCDIEMDKRAHRSTLAVVLGRKDSTILYRILLVVWVVLIALFVAIFYPVGSLGLFFLLLAYPTIKSLLRNPLIPPSRIAAMQTIVNLNSILGLVYAFSILLSAVVVVIA